MVGVAGFEPTASSSQAKRSTKLSHTPALESPFYSIVSEDESSEASFIKLSHTPKNEFRGETLEDYTK